MGIISKTSQTKFHQIRITKSKVIHIQVPVTKWKKTKKWEKISGLRNGAIRELQIWADFRDSKSGLVGLQIGQLKGFKIGAKRFQIWAKITNRGKSHFKDRGRDYKSVQNNKDTCIKRMENLLSDQRKFEKVTFKNDAFLNVAVNQEKRIDTIFKSLVDSNSMSKEMCKFVKPVGTRPGIMYGNCKVHKQQVDGCPPFRPILSALQTPTYNLAKFLVPILNPLTKNEYTVKDSFQFAEEICEQDSTLSMGILDVDSLFAIISLDETIDICVNQLFENTDTVEGFK